MVRLLLFIILALFSRSDSSGSSSLLSRIKRGAKCRRFGAALDGGQEVNSTDVPGKCQATFRLNAKKDKLSYIIKCQELSSKPVAVDIRESAVDKNGTFSVPIELKGGRKQVARNSTKAVDIGNDKFEDLIDLIFGGKAYVDIRTRKYSSGEVRGHIISPANCLEMVEETEKSICALPAVTGPCKARFLRWYYDDEKEECGQFIYGGCRGNENNFKTKSECEASCSAMEKKEEEKKSVCSLPAEMGPCKAFFQRWYYDGEKEECGEFIYGGCRGNGNNFETKSACEASCFAIEKKEEEKKSICSLPALTGKITCLAYIPRWRYEDKVGECIEFIYGGCGGNENNFETKDECESVCPKDT